jgi:hypothetical protein
MTSNVGIGLSPIYLGIFPWLKFQWKKHFSSHGGLFVARDAVANGGFAALIALFTDHLKDPVGRVALFAW